MPLKLKQFREEMLEVSQEELSEMIGLDFNEIVEYENGSKSLSEELSRQIVEKTGVDIFEVGREGYYYKEIQFKAWVPNIPEKDKMIKDKINSYNFLLTNLLDEREIIKSPVLKDFNDRKVKIISSLLDNIKKPSITLFGASSSGKSTMINHILGDKTLPTSWTPTTSVSTKIIHLEDKPKHMGESNVGVFKTSKFEDNLVETHKLYNKEYFKEHLLTKGDYNLIEDFGKHGGEKYKENKIKELEFNYTIVCYLDKPILHACDIWDIPGTNAKKEDDIIAENSTKGADITLYLSKASQFMQLEDMAYIKELVKEAPDFVNRYDKTDLFENFFIIASQANEIKRGSDNNESIDEILDKRINDFYETIPEKYFNKQKGIDFNFTSIRERAFDFDVETERAKKRLKNALLELLQKITNNRYEILEKYEKELFYQYNVELRNTIENLSEKSEAKKNLENFLEEKKKHLQQNEELVNSITQTAKELKIETINEIKDIYRNEINESNVEYLIDMKDFGKKKRDQERFVQWFQNEIESQINDVINKHSQTFSEMINKKLNYIAEQELNKVNVGGFNFVANFVGGLSSLATVGAFSVYFSSLGNLGGYIFISQAVSVLSSLGISVGGTASVASAVSVIGGPMTIAIGIAIVAGMTIKTLISKTAWKKDLAKKLVKGYDKASKPKRDEDQTFRGYTPKEIFLYQANSYWEDTINALNVDLFDEQLEKVEAELREKAKVDDKQKAIKEELEKLKFEVA
ncbi:helix-turn-helix transcriptional regulator [Staphylococcus sp. GDY8P57P]|uniref:helix-turn-helix domain-containing protein n=1 Tax=Staphylococcus sp. GDY8P57P TaxID=2804128 RepID=UPI001881E7BC|nr:helix-turn-helix transcriptional regulator [Staphylococcus sp. GDY8P57P]MBF2758419.1 dynamin family protein [Staphylococcus haemolyticus]MBF2774810.1 dynamin family protein [Staphylococcus haemolyticus]MBF2777097.1 dynamin family protein [Staphylococcus haemolyticus]MBF2816691.1 dynamin family protein [Staphylococcus haemolyticus]MBF9721226.1 dynamin family protein [Staphylococcus haemolyticus]